MAQLLRAIYVGPKINLLGECALVRPIPDSIFIDAQFTNIDTGYGYGWHEFYASDFEIIPWGEEP
jgi:hypothetical protein